MLIDRGTTINVSDIVTVKLISGEEIVGKVIERTIDSFFLGKPVQISIQPVNQTQVGLAFLPVLGSCPETASIQIPLTAMAIRPVKTGDDVKRSYIQATSDIVTPTPHQTSIITS